MTNMATTAMVTAAMYRGDSDLEADAAVDFDRDGELEAVRLTRALLDGVTVPLDSLTERERGILETSAETLARIKLTEYAEYLANPSLSTEGE